MKYALLIILSLTACTFSGKIDADVECTGDCDTTQQECHESCETECANAGGDADSACDTDCVTTCDEAYEECTVTCSSTD